MAAASFFCASAQKLSPLTSAFLSKQSMPANTVRRAMLISSDSATVASTASNATTFKAFIEISSDKAIPKLEQCGVKINLKYPGHVTAVVPLTAVEAIQAIPEVTHINIASRVAFLNDSARAIGKVNEVQLNSLKDLPQAYKGEGVIIGVVDTGMEYYHRAFRDAKDDSKLRISRVWNQAAVGAPPSGFDFGAEYSNTDEIRAAKYDNTDGYHATHVTGIAAGSKGIGTNYYGVAPESEIVFVSIGEDGTDVDVPEAVKYIFDYADEVGKPCVINLSLGSHQGPHDGTSATDKFFDSVVGPGRVIVGAAGNEGDGAQHAGKIFTATDTVFKTTLGYPSTTPKNTGIEIYGSRNVDLKIRVAVVDITKKGRVVAQSDLISAGSGNTYKGFTEDETGAEADFIVYPGTDADRSCFYIESYVTSLNSNRRLAIFAYGNEGEEVHLWNLTGYDFLQPANASDYTAGDCNYTVGEIGGTSESVISVGACNSRNYFPVYWDSKYLYGVGSTFYPAGDLCYFSSCGPTLDGRIKPDVAAPGYFLISAASSYYGDETFWTGSSEAYPAAVDRVQDSEGRYSYYYLDAGTSMSSPFVAGTVALWLQANPNLSPADVRRVISKSSTANSYTGDLPNNRFGYGIINAYAGIKYVINNAGIADATTDCDVKVWADREERAIYCSAGDDATIAVYDLSGKLMGEFRGSRIDASAWPHGIYVTKVSTPQSSISAKLAL